MSSNIPLARDKLVDIANRLEEAGHTGFAREIDKVVDFHMRRQSATRKARPISRPFTPELAQAIRVFASKKPQRTQMEIAQTFGVNVGRVSEALSELAH